MKIKWSYHRDLPSRIKKIIVKRESDGRYFIILSVNVDKQDMNIAVATSSGKTYLKTITKIEKYTKEYKKLQKVLSKRYKEAEDSRKKVSKNTKKTAEKTE